MFFSFCEEHFNTAHPLVSMQYHIVLFSMPIALLLRYFWGRRVVKPIIYEDTAF